MIPFRFRLTGILALTLAALTPGRAQQISIVGGNLLMSVTTGSAGAQPVAVTSTTSSLHWKRQNVISKITVAASCPGQRFSLAVLATNLTYGVAAPQVSLFNGMLATDFVLSIPTGNPLNKTCTLRYTASSTFAQGNSTELGNDVYSITYTLVAQ
ncbi:MAG TPA: hypothetical protein VL221_01880 [Bacteroidota bacterium]|nr:hypothetical protein [Bacteroidota bacterium]